MLYRRRVPAPTAKWCALVILASFGYAMWQELAAGAQPAQALGFSLLVTGFIAIVLLGIWALPVIGEGKSVRIDEKGLRIAGRRLPSEAVGTVRRVRDPRLRGFGFLTSVGGKRIRQTRSFVHGKDAEAVLIEDLRDRRAGKRSPWWAVQVPEREEFITALLTAAGRAKSPEVRRR